MISSVLAIFYREHCFPVLKNSLSFLHLNIGYTANLVFIMMNSSQAPQIDFFSTLNTAIELAPYIINL